MKHPKDSLAKIRNRSLTHALCHYSSCTSCQCRLKLKYTATHVLQKKQSKKSLWLDSYSLATNLMLKRN